MSPQMWLIVSELNDPLAREVTGALRAAGERAVLVDSPEMVGSYARDDIPCVLVLPVIKPILPDAMTVALSLAFAAHIPVVAGKEITPPAGPWTSAAIDGTERLEDVVAQLQSAWEALSARTGEERQAHAQEYGLAPPPTPAISASEVKEQRRKQLTKTFRIMQLVILILTIAFATYNFITLRNYHYTPPPTFPVGQTYSAHVPGPCPDAKGDWSWDQQDKYTCNSDGLLMTRTDLKYSFSNMDLSLYTGTSAGFFQSSYAVQITGTIIEAESSACIGLAVHQQDDASEQYFEACKDGKWSIGQLKKDGYFNKFLGFGDLPHPQNTYTLRVEVYDTTMTYSVDGSVVDTVDDPAYTTTLGVGFLIDGSDSPGLTEEALFSDFSVTPYGNATPDEAQKQVLATNQKIIDSPYRTHIPGYGCDHGSGGWSPNDYENDPSLVTFTCHSDGFTMVPSQNGNIAQEDYFNRLGLYPESYSLATTITFGTKGNICSGISTTFYTPLQRIFVICSDRSWRIYHLTGDGSDVTDASGTGPKVSTYHLVVTLKAGIETMTINGKAIPASLAPLDSGDFTKFISLADYAIDATTAAGSATFSDFSFTPLS
jgi:hypothetical protein